MTETVEAVHDGQANSWGCQISPHGITAAFGALGAKLALALADETAEGMTGYSREMCRRSRQGKCHLILNRAPRDDAKGTQ